MKCKKILACAVASLTLASTLCLGGVFAANELNNPVFNAPMIPEGYSIKVDGKMDEIWTAVEPMAIERTDTDAGAATDTTGTLRVMWDDSGFYAFVEVDKHGQDIVSPCLGGVDLEVTDDTVKFGWVNGGENQGWTHPGTVEYAYCGMIAGDADGNLSTFGWYAAYGSDQVEYSYRKVADDKYDVELFVSWVEPNRAEVYGPAGVGEGSVVMFDAVIYSHNPSNDEISYTAWSEYPYYSLGGSQTFGYLLLTEEANPDDIKDISEDTTGGATPVEDVTPSDSETPADDATPTNEATADENTPSEKKADKKENAPATLDIASAVAAVAIASFGVFVITKKKHR